MASDELRAGEPCGEGRGSIGLNVYSMKCDRWLYCAARIVAEICKADSYFWAFWCVVF